VLTAPLDEQVAALDAGRAYAGMDDHRVTLVSGSDARGWLNDLVTTDVENLASGQMRTSLLLTPTGRIRALFHVLGRDEDRFLLVQRADQPERIERVLEPYVLSSDVTLAPADVRILAVAGDDAVTGPGTVSRPSVLGGGVDLLVETDPDRGVSPAAAGLLVGADAVEARRIRRGQPRFGRDLEPGSLPSEAGLDTDPVTDRGKGCFLGQEAVARIANLGHPTRVVLEARSDRPLSAGEPVLGADGAPAGSVTSADGETALVVVRWEAARGRLATRDGTPLRTSPPAREPV
jgi:folate-binding protein YgfZ